MHVIIISMIPNLYLYNLKYITESQRHGGRLQLSVLQTLQFYRTQHRQCAWYASSTSPPALHMQQARQSVCHVMSCLYISLRVSCSQTLRHWYDRRRRKLFYLTYLAVYVIYLSNLAVLQYIYIGKYTQRLMNTRRCTRRKLRLFTLIKNVS